MSPCHEVALDTGAVHLRKTGWIYRRQFWFPISSILIRADSRAVTLAPHAFLVHRAPCRAL